MTSQSDYPIIKIHHGLKVFDGEPETACNDIIDSNAGSLDDDLLLRRVLNHFHNSDEWQSVFTQLALPEQRKLKILLGQAYALGLEDMIRKASDGQLYMQSHIDDFNLAVSSEKDQSHEKE